MVTEATKVNGVTAFIIEHQKELFEPVNERKKENSSSKKKKKPKN
jgi:hypothetical protein